MFQTWFSQSSKSNLWLVVEEGKTGQCIVNTSNSASNCDSWLPIFSNFQLLCQIYSQAQSGLRLWALRPLSIHRDHLNLQNLISNAGWTLGIQKVTWNIFQVIEKSSLGDMLEPSQFLHGLHLQNWYMTCQKSKHVKTFQYPMQMGHHFLSSSNLVQSSHVLVWVLTSIFVFDK